MNRILVARIHYSEYVVFIADGCVFRNLGRVLPESSDLAVWADGVVLSRSRYSDDEYEYRHVILPKALCVLHLFRCRLQRS